ncbi:MAG: class I SAM-dependent methyltransferase [Eubacteriales bacterium]|nr:class I SAM-dependent methyltransferase [Eubacteriales bacterium]
MMIDDDKLNNSSQNIYDNQTFFDGYKKLRDNPDSANILEEKPALFSLAPDLTGKAVLDLGCGYGENCAEFKRLGASRVVGIDISGKMLEVAKNENTEIEFIKADMSDLSFIDGRFDIVFSSLAVHYIKDFDSFVAGVSRILADGGVFIFSQEHPLTTAPPAGASWTRDENKNVLHYNLMGYMRSGLRSTTWLVDNVIKYHRPFSEIVNVLIDNGFAIEKMIETVPTEETIKRLPHYEKDLDKPNFLLIKAQKRMVS